MGVESLCFKFIKTNVYPCAYAQVKLKKLDEHMEQQLLITKSSTNYK